MCSKITFVNALLLLFRSQRPEGDSTREADSTPLQNQYVTGFLCNLLLHLYEVILHVHMPIYSIKPTKSGRCVIEEGKATAWDIPTSKGLL